METTTESQPSETALIEAIVAWHNRHPLAHRIVAPQVRGIGVVGLPFAQQTPGKRPKPLFSERFISTLKPAAITRLAWRSGSLQRPANADWPQRNIPVDPSRADELAEIRFLRTAAIELGSRRIRILIGNGNKPTIIGRRIWNRQRSMALLAFATLLTLGGGATHLWWPEPAAAAIALADAGNPATAESQPGLQDAPAPAETQQAATSPAPADETDAGSAPIVAAEASEEPALADAVEATEVEEPEHRSAEAPSRSRAEIAPAAVAEPTRQVARGGAAPAPAPAPAPAAAPAPAPAAAAAAEDGAVYALATASTSSRLASQLRIGFMNVPTDPADDRPHAELMRVGQRWRVVIWPFGSRAAAESLRKALAEQGLKTELIGF